MKDEFRDSLVNERKGGNSDKELVNDDRGIPLGTTVEGPTDEGAIDEGPTDLEPTVNTEDTGEKPVSLKNV